MLKTVYELEEYEMYQLERNLAPLLSGEIITYKYQSVTYQMKLYHNVATKATNIIIGTLEE